MSIDMHGVVSDWGAPIRARLARNPSCWVCGEVIDSPAYWWLDRPDQHCEARAVHNWCAQDVWPYAPLYSSEWWTD